MRSQPPRHDTLLAALMVVVALASIASVVLSAPVFTVTVPRTLFGVTRRSVETRPRDGSVAVATATPGVGIEEPAGAPSESPAEPGPLELAAAAPGLALGTQARIVNTDGVGVVLHAAPRAGARRPAGLLEGRTVTVLELAGVEWARVQADAKLAGWVPTSFLAPIP
jgi:hypothetical protein